jgi:hypothetical protein
MEYPSTFVGMLFVSDNPNWKHHGETLVVVGRNSTDLSYYDCLALDGSSPAVSESHLKEMYRAGKLKPPARA